jgi:hypothetical protein
MRPYRSGSDTTDDLIMIFFALMLVFFALWLVG